MSERDERPETADSTADPNAEATGPAPIEGFEEPTPAIPWRVALILLIGAVVVVFAVQNTQNVQLQFLGWDWRMPLVIVILVTLILSVLADEIIGGIVRRRRVRRRRERDELRRLKDLS